MDLGDEMTMGPALLALSVENYLSLREVDVDLGPVNVLVGPNGAGKSNLLDVIQLLGDSVREDLSPAIDSRGGFDRIYFNGDTKGPIRIRVRANVTKYSSATAPDEYSLTLSRAGLRRDYVRRWETFKFKRFQGPGRRITVQGSSVHVVSGKTTERELELRRDTLGLATLPRLSPSQGGEEISRVASLFQTFRVFNVDVAKAKLPSTQGESGHLESDASNLAGFLQWLSMEHEDVFVELLKDARELIPGLLDMRFVPVGGSTFAVALVLEETGLKNPTPLAYASYGTIRILALLALLHDPEPPLLTCIEEMDHGIHPYAFDRLVERLRIASRKTQFLVATHSPALVNRLTAPELIVCERNESGASLIPAIDLRTVQRVAKSVEGELGLGEIWFTGTLGGVPT
jgi:predicted ATPase